MRIKSTPMTWYTILLIITCLVAILVPGNPTSLHSLHINEEVYRLLIISILVPYAIIWFAAFYGYDQLARYSRALAFTGEGKAFRKIAKGLGVLAWGLIVQVLLSLLVNATVIGHPGFKAPGAIISHYFGLLIALGGFVYIENGTSDLVEQVHASRSHAAIRWLIVISALIGALFQRTIIINQHGGNNPYYLSIYPLIFTIIVPYVFTWSIGIVAVYELNLYMSKVKGLLYKHSLQFLANGLSIIVIMFAAAQFIAAAISPGNNTSLASILLFDYALLIAVALGFVLVAFGAKRMKRIEEV